MAPHDKDHSPATGSETVHDLQVLAFENADLLDRWLGETPRTIVGVWLKLAKKSSGVQSVSRAEAVDVGLCHGWIDGQQRPYDDRHWLVRFTPRRRASRWSEINRNRALELLAENRMRSAGLAEVEAARADGRWDAAYAPASTASVPPDLRAALDASPKATEAFAGLTRTKRYAILYRMGTIKKPETRVRRIVEFVAELEGGETTDDPSRAHTVRS